MFEYDDKKSKANFKKHGIDFETAQLLWNDTFFLEIPAKTLNEPRFIVIGLIGNEHWSGVITYRENNIRIISVHRSRREEIDLYEGEWIWQKIWKWNWYSQQFGSIESKKNHAGSKAANLCYLPG